MESNNTRKSETIRTEGNIDLLIYISFFFFVKVVEYKSLQDITDLPDDIYTYFIFIYIYICAVKFFFFFVSYFNERRKNIIRIQTYRCTFTLNANVNNQSTHDNK